MRCNCESAYCTQHGGVLEGPDAPRCDPCPNQADGSVVMDWVGPVCDECAQRTMETTTEILIHKA